MKLPWEEIEGLTKYLKDKGLSEISIETKDGKISVKKDLGVISSIPVIQPKKEEPLKEKTTEKSPANSNLRDVISPMVGTFYQSPTPGAEPFVKVGSKVKSGDVLCIIEAMKIMNELPAEVNGTVAEILVKESQVVEYGQIIMRIESN